MVITGMLDPLLIMTILETPTDHFKSKYPQNTFTLHLDITHHVLKEEVKVSAKLANLNMDMKAGRLIDEVGMGKSKNYRTGAFSFKKEKDK